MTAKATVRFDRLEYIHVPVSPRTEWTFVEITETSGLVASTEITSGHATPQAVSELNGLFHVLKGVAIKDESDLHGLCRLSDVEIHGNLPLSAAMSTLRTAVVDIQAQAAGASMTEALGGAFTESVRLYANINRCLLSDRSPLSFGKAAERAVNDGFVIVKCAPFDEVKPFATEGEILDMAAPGIRRVAAVRAAVGPDVQVLVDCHSRFQVQTALLVADELARLDVGWFEEPLDPLTDAQGLARVAAALSMPVPGGEKGYGEGFFKALLEDRAVGIIMPDIKYCGGVAEAVKAGRCAERLGGDISLHSPSGPVSQLHSAHVTAALPHSLALEHAVYETPWRADLIEPPERIECGRLRIPPGPGLGARLDQRAVERYGRRLKP